MTQAKAVIVPLHRPARRRRIDLALALSVLAKAVRVHEKVLMGRYEHAKPLGA